MATTTVGEGVSQGGDTAGRGGASVAPPSSTPRLTPPTVESKQVFGSVKLLHRQQLLF
jgi:hypothetical protein